MIENRVTSRELLPDVWSEDQVTWLLPIAPELETRVWPVSLAVPLTRTALPVLALANENYNGSVSNGRISQPQKWLPTPNAIILSPPLLPYRTLGIYMNGVAINFVDITSLKRTEEKLRQNQQQLESLNKELAELVAERTEQVRRLASEVLITEQKVQKSISQLLHDDLQQLLFSIDIKVEMLHSSLPASEQDLLDQTEEIRNSVNRALQVTRRVAVNLALPFLPHQNFMKSLDFLAALMGKMYGLKVGMKGAELSKGPQKEVGVLLIQIVRELLFNVVKHAGVNQATVEVFEEDGRLRIEVLDHGQGFDTAAAMVEGQQGSSLGLASIRERLALFGGQFQIESQVAQGTRVTIVTLM
jgi:two-component system CheB/CheR fusion protein